MKKTGLLLIGLAIAILANGQTLKIQGGTSISKLDWQLEGIILAPLYTEALIGYSIFAGLDYLENQYYNLSTSVGMIRRGGRGEFAQVNPHGEFTGQIITDKSTLDYLSINTMIDLKYRIKEMVSPFISFGPRLDYLVNSSWHFDDLKEIDGLKRASYGLILGGGLKYDISDFQFGLRADYYLDFTKVADWTIESTGISGEVKVNTFTINLIIGYRLR